MQNTLIEIMSVEEKSGVSKKTGQPYNMRGAHAVVYLPEGKQVGVVRMPRDMPSPAPGFYEAVFGLAIDFQTRDVVGRLVELKPASAPGAISDAYITGTDTKAGSKAQEKKAA